MIRVLAMSDTHGKQSRYALPHADLFVHTGDFSNFGGGVEEFAIWYWQLPYQHKLLILGNHEGRDAVAKRLLPTWRRLFGPTLLDHQACALSVGDEHLIVYGAPYGANAFDDAPRTPTMVLTHEPPLGILDRNIGSSEVNDYVRQSHPLLHIFGHVHEQGGRSTTHDQTLYVNAATRAMLIDVGEGASVSRCLAPRS